MRMRWEAAGMLWPPLLLVFGCSINTLHVLDEGVAPSPGGAERGGEEARKLAQLARGYYEEDTRTETAVWEAYRQMMASVRATPEGDTARYGRLVDAARYAVWLALRPSGRVAGSMADSAMILGNTLVADDSMRVEGYYFRSIAAGLVAREDRLRGRSAMIQIREDARRAVTLDPGFEEGGPHRVLGALYLRAPGPPAGVGSLVRAIQNLERALELGPESPENRLYLAEAYIEGGRDAQAREVLREVEAMLRTEDPPRREELTTWLAELRERLGVPALSALPGAWRGS